MKRVVSAEGAKISPGMVQCRQCGGTEHVVEYCRCHDGKELQELRCAFCEHKIRIELEEVK